MLLTFLCLHSAVANSQENKGKYEDVSTLINVWLEAQKDYQDIPFMSGVVVKDQQILWSGAFGNANREGAVPSNVNTMSSICSISKIFTATAVMKLVDQGKLSLDDKVKDILPKYSVIQKFTEGGSVTVRSLLNHTSGLPRDTNHGYYSAPEHPFPTEDEMFESLSIQATESPVGTDISYSNIGYALLGLIIEEVTGVTYKNYIEASIFQPLNMSNSVVEMQSSLYGNKHARAYTAINRNGKRKVANFYQTKAMQSAMGISTTALDMAKFAKWQFRLADASQAEILQPSTLKSMHHTQATSQSDNEYDRGFGYEVTTDDKGIKWAMHGGTCPGYVSFYKMDVTNKVAYTILVNANKVYTPSYVKGLIYILNLAESIETEVKEEEKEALELAQYTGFYNLNPWNSEYYVGSWGRGLMLLYLPAQSLKYALQYYQHVEGDTFQLVENGKLSNDKIYFSRDEQNRVIKIKNEGNTHTRITYPEKQITSRVMLL
ncbi:serine hydrolase domain-containing protein [Colwellia piezophila]|uniref:serine hydrolase domain-containing protein n=1 Tax=Colwellia piezophila TaxID=211668 RepID=UPI001B7FC526|nr:serine hydrolase domain-containing protein [Colwellia piezophila]